MKGEITMAKKEVAIGIANANDDTYQIIENEFDQIRKAIGMYISKTGTEGALHLLKENVNNSIDELVNAKSNGNTIIVEFWEDDQKFRVQDDGRGIPFDRMVSSCTKKHSSTKIDRTVSWVKGLAGRNGVGLVITAATTSYMEMVSSRDGYRKTIRFIDGVMEKETKPEKLKNPHESGTSTIFAPSEAYLLGHIHITPDMVEDYLRCMSYVLPKHVKIEYVAHLKDKKHPYTKTYKFLGIAEAVNHMSATLEFKPVVLEIESDNFDMDASFSYDKTVDEMQMDSYCNYIHTTEGGNHETVIISTLCSFFTREARKLEPNAKYEITYADCRKGLIVAVNCSHVDPAFEGQHKTKVTNQDVLDDAPAMLTESLAKYFDKDNGLLRKIIQYLRMVAKARLEANKIKGVKVAKNTTFIDDLAIPGFKNITDRHYSGYTEIFLTEGLSAGGSINNARNRKYQAILEMRGPINNIWSMSYEVMMTKPMCRNLVTVLGCGAGKYFDIAKLRWSRIILFTDADIDGANLSSLLICFIWKWMPDIITSGRLYLVTPPLYLLEEKDYKKLTKKTDNWIYNISEYYAIINNSAAEMLSIWEQTEAGKNAYLKMKKNDVKNLLNHNLEYLGELDALVKKSSTIPLLIEHVCYAKLLYGDDINQIIDYLHIYFPEVVYHPDDECLKGSYQGGYVNLIMDHIFFHSAKRFMYHLEKNRALMYGVGNRSDKSEAVEEMTLGQILSLIKSQVVLGVKQRYKGLGEADAYYLYIATMHPKFRKLKRIVISNEKEAENTLYMLHGENDKARELRRELLKATPISYFDIDN